MSGKTNLKIIEEPNVIDDHLLDIIGNEFKFDHEKGLAEWLKNSVDAYIRLGIPDSKQYVIFRFADGQKEDATFECIDFIGMSEVDIEKAFKRWGDPEAAKRGLNKRVYGGHGNGGKFYMRQMFSCSQFLTYKDGRLSIFGFNENKKYGFADGYRSKSVKPAQALEITGLKDLNFPKGLKEDVLSGKRGFTVVQGIGPAKMKNIIKFDRLTEKLKSHPQARRILDRITVWATHNNFPNYILLKSDEIKPLPKFEQARTIEIPKILTTADGREEIKIEMSNKKYKLGYLVLKTSEEAFGKGSRSADLNRIDIVGEIGVIASYQLYELGVSVWPQASFIYGECSCPILEDSDMDAVKNDRSKLVEMPRSEALLKWIKAQIDLYADEIAALERKEQDAQRKKISAAYNDFLNKWKDRFMNKLIGDMFSPGGDSTGDNPSHLKKILEAPENGLAFSSPVAQIEYNKEEKITLKATIPDPISLGSIIKLNSSNKMVECEDDKIIVKTESVKATTKGENVSVMNIIVVGKELGAESIISATAGELKAEIILTVIEASDSQKAKKPKTPKILLSGNDPDPLNLASGGTVTLTERDPLVYQRYQDVQEGIYWINTQSPLAKAILNKYNDSSVRWRDYLFQRYVDIFIKQAIHELQKRDPDGFRADRIDSEILDGLTRKVHTAALNDLGSFFFEEQFEPMAEQHE